MGSPPPYPLQHCRNAMPQEDLSCMSMTSVYMRIAFILRRLTFSSPQFFLSNMQEAVIKEVPYMDTLSPVIHSIMGVGKTVAKVRTSAMWGIVAYQMS
jgi:hypothetical protein